MSEQQHGEPEEEDLVPSQLRDDGKREELAESLALETAARAGAPSEASEATRYLSMQSQMLGLQMEHLHEQRRLVVSHLKLRRYNERLRVALQSLTVAVGVVAAVAVGVAAWQASRDRSLVIEPFATPADFPNKGLGGVVVATHLLDKLAALKSDTDSARAPDTYHDSWSKQIKVEIPQTGVSVSEALNILRQWLGHQTRITGEVVKTETGVAVTARTGDAAGETFRGPEAELGALLEQAAASIYAQTQPYRYGVYLFFHGHTDEAVATLAKLAVDGPSAERPWAYVGWGAALGALGRRVEGRERVLNGLALDPRLAAGWNVLAEMEEGMGRDGRAHAARLRLMDSLRQGRSAGLAPRAERQQRLNTEARLREDGADYAGAAPFLLRASESEDYQAVRGTLRARLAIDRVLAHAPVDAEAAVAALPSDELDRPFYAARLVVARAAQDDGWAAAAPALLRLEAEARTGPAAAYRRQILLARLQPWTAYALERAGRRPEADARIAATPGDSVSGQRVRGLVAAARGDLSGARACLDRASAAAPASPLPAAELGGVLLAAGDLVGAETAFGRARRLAPRWADAALGLGRVALRRGRRDEASRLAAAAHALAPAWSAPGELAKAARGR